MATALAPSGWPNVVVLCTFNCGQKESIKQVPFLLHLFSGRYGMGARQWLLHRFYLWRDNLYV